MLTLADAMEKANITNTMAGALVGIGKSAVSRVKAHDYPNWQNLEKAIIRKMIDGGLLQADEVPELDVAPGVLRVDPYVFINTQNVNELEALANDLLDNDTTLNASIGLVTGRAGYGKTTAIQHYAATTDPAVYILYIEGYTMTMLTKAIAQRLTGTCSRTYEGNLNIIRDATMTFRKLIIIDEADRLPIKYLEMLRGFNEECQVPILLVGEESLVSKLASQPRLHSRIRKPEIVFKPLTIVDVATYYQQAVGLDISSQTEACKTLLRWAGKDFRVLVNDAQHIVQIMNTSGISELTQEVLDAYKPFRS